MPRIDKWDARFMALAVQARTWVKGPDLGVGACLVSPDRRGFSLGYSGLPRGMADTTGRITDHAFKDHLTVHAELNAILNAPGPVVGWTLYVTQHPCARCAAAAIQAGMTRVVADVSAVRADSRWWDSWEHAAIAFGEAGVEFESYGGYAV